MNYRQLLEELENLDDEALEQEVTVVWDGEVFEVDYATISDDGEFLDGMLILYAE